MNYLFQTVHTVKMEATRVVCEVFFLLEDGNFGLSEGKQSDFKRERTWGYLPEASLNLYLGGNREGEALDGARVRR